MTMPPDPVAHCSCMSVLAGSTAAAQREISELLGQAVSWGHVPVLELLVERFGAGAFGIEDIMAAGESNRMPALQYLVNTWVQAHGGGQQTSGSNSTGIAAGSGDDGDWDEVFSCAAGQGADLSLLRLLHERCGAAIDLAAGAAGGSEETIQWAVGTLWAAGKVSRGRLVLTLGFCGMLVCIVCVRTEPLKSELDREEIFAKAVNSIRPDHRLGQHVGRQVHLPGVTDTLPRTVKHACTTHLIMDVLPCLFTISVPALQCMPWPTGRITHRRPGVAHGRGRQPGGGGLGPGPRPAVAARQGPAAPGGLPLHLCV